MSTYNISATPFFAPLAGIMFKVGFGETGTNQTIVKDASLALASLGELGGKLALVNGPASLPVAMVLCHSLAHRFGAVACFDPKMQGYVVAVSHDPEYQLGDLITP